MVMKNFRKHPNTETAESDADHKRFLLMLYWENKAIHDTDGSQLCLDLIVKVVTVAEAAPAASAI